MTDMPERIWATPHDGYCTATEIKGQAGGALGFIPFIRADLVSAKDAEIARLRGLLTARDGGAHDAFCATKRPRRWGHGPCTCGHNAVAAYFREIEG